MTCVLKIMSTTSRIDFGAFCQQAADNVFPIVQHIAKSYALPGA